MTQVIACRVCESCHGKGGEHQSAEEPCHGCGTTGACPGNVCYGLCTVCGGKGTVLTTGEWVECERCDGHGNHLYYREVAWWIAIVRLPITALRWCMDVRKPMSM